MNKDILSTEVQLFINSNLKTDLVKLRLKISSVGEVDTIEVLQQIESKLKTQTKLPTWFQTPEIFYPKKVHVEQASSETAADYKSSLIGGNTILDITGGMGVDDFYFSKCFNQVYTCEINPELAEITKHNFQVLGVKNNKVLNEDGIKFLGKTEKNFDWIYIDPSRRPHSKGKIFMLQDSEPNVIENLALLRSRGKRIMIKTSPLLDISSGVKDLKHVEEIHVVSINNEVKELLWILDAHSNQDLTIVTVNITQNDKEEFTFPLSEEHGLDGDYSEPLNYLYEPNASIMKSGGFNSLSQKLELPKLHPNSHLYTSIEKVEFPGRVFKIQKKLPYHPKTLKKELPKTANIATRNFPKTVAEIRKELKIKDGGNTYIFFSTDKNSEKIVLVCNKA
ncbi:MAG: class I SAM-dependent methyltransferase [Flavobacteriaceae bacterium]|nr:class I SAM-dependent methyltransferase [Flavobacteriaceae bacterium]